MLETTNYVFRQSRELEEQKSVHYLVLWDAKWFYLVREKYAQRVVKHALICFWAVNKSVQNADNGCGNSYLCDDLHRRKSSISS